MPSHIISLLTALLATTGSAQIFSHEHVATLTLAEQSAIDSSIECGDYYDSAAPAAIAVGIYGSFRFTTGTCYNVAEMFSKDSYDNDTLVTHPDTGAVSSCQPSLHNPNCRDEPYMALGLNHFSLSANYSRVQVDFLYGLGQSVNSAVRRINVTVFADEGCEQDAAEPWFSWGGCEGEGREQSCRELPYSVKSFRMGQVVSTLDLECMIGAERGAGTQMTTSAMSVILGGAVVVSMMVMM
jgi:hypothetical protein